MNNTECRKILIRRPFFPPLISIVLLFATFLFFLVQCSHQVGSDYEESSTLVSVHTSRVLKATLHRYITGYGRVEPQPAEAGQPGAGALLSTPASGLLIEVNCRQGEPVEKGQLLFRLDDRLALAALDKAHQQFDYAQKTYERQKKLLEVNGTSQKSFQEAEDMYNTARAELAAAQAQLSYLHLTAPISGVVVKLNARVGQNVDSSAVLAEIVDLDRLIISAGLPRLEASFLRKGQPVEVFRPAEEMIDTTLKKTSGQTGETPGQVSGQAVATTSSISSPLKTEAMTSAPIVPIQGVLSLVAQEVDPKTDTVPVRILLPSGSGLRPGEFLSFRVVAETKENCLAVPEASLVSSPEEGSWLMVVEGDSAHRLPVKPGLRDGGLVEVSGEGLKEGLVIVTDEAYSLPSHTKIKIIESKS